MSPKHYFEWQVCNAIASRDSPGLAEIKTNAQKMQDAQVTKSLYKAQLGQGQTRISLQQAFPHTPMLYPKGQQSIFS